MRIACALLAMACLAGRVSAADADWWWLGEFNKAPQRFEMYVDRSSIIDTGNHRIEAWAYYVQESPLADDEIVAATRQRVDCKARTVVALARKAYDDKGKQIQDSRFDALPLTQIVAGSAADIFRRHVCRDNPPPAVSVNSPIAHAMKMWGRSAGATSAQAQTDEPAIDYGTGFFVSPEGQLVTAWHVVDGASKIVVYTADRTAHPARIAKASPATDLAVLDVDYRPKHYLTLAPPNSARAGDRVFTFGYPVVDLLGSEPKFTDGAISAVTGVGDEAAFAQISVPVQPGNSGGPLVNEKGEVVGVIASGAREKEFSDAAGGALPQNVNWAVRSEYVAPLLRSGPPRPVKSRDEAIALARDSIAMVEVELADSGEN